MRTKSILLTISFLLIFACKQVKNEDTTNLLKSSHENIDKVDKKKSIKNKSTQIESECFTKSDFQQVGLLFKSIIKKKPNQIPFLYLKRRI